MVLATMKIPQLQFLNEVFDVPGMQVVQVLPCRLPVVCNDRCPPQLQLLNMVVYTTVVAQRLAPMVRTVRRTKSFPLAGHDDRCPCFSGLGASPSRSHPCRGAETVSHGLADHGDSAVARGQGEELMEVAFLALHRGAGPGRSCPQGHGPQN